MKSYFLLLLLIGSVVHDGFAQSVTGDQSTKWTRTEQLLLDLKWYKLVSLDMLDSLYEVSRYTLNTQELYGVDETIEVYNVKIAGIALFSVLPDFFSESSWTEVKLEDIQEAILNDREFNRIVRDQTLSSGSRTKTMSVRLLKQEDDKCWISNVCLLELFAPDAYVSDVHPFIFNVRQGRINIQQTPVSIAQMMEVYSESPLFLEFRPFPLDFRTSMFSILPNRPELEREYLSRIIEIKGGSAYQFWILTDWSARDSYCYNRGVDRFIYMPDKGIVGGSYDFYFLYKQDPGWPGTLVDLRPRHRKTKEELWQNVIEEKVMLAEELKRSAYDFPFSNGKMNIDGDTYHVFFSNYLPEIIVVNMTKNPGNSPHPQSYNAALRIPRNEIHVDTIGEKRILCDVLKSKLKSLKANHEGIRINYVFDKTGSVVSIDYVLPNKTLITPAELAEIDQRIRKEVKASFTIVDYRGQELIGYTPDTPIYF